MVPPARLQTSFPPGASRYHCGSHSARGRLPPCAFSCTQALSGRLRRGAEGGTELVDFKIRCPRVSSALTLFPNLTAPGTVSGVPPGSRHCLTAHSLTVRVPGLRQGHCGFVSAKIFGVVRRASPGMVSAAKDLVLCFGEMLVDMVPTENGVSLAEAQAFVKAPGGAPANVAVGVARLGGHAAFMGKVGDEEFGRMLVGILEQNGVDVRGVRLDSAARTALAFVTLRSDGEREFMFYRHPSADMLLTPEELDADVINEAAIVHFGSISLIAEPCRSAHERLLQLAQQSGALLSYDANLRLALWPSPEDARSGILSIWDKAHVAKVSEEEVAFLTPEGAEPSALARSVFAQQLALGAFDDLDKRALSLWHDNLKVLLLTEGSKGSRYYMHSGGTGAVKAFPVTAIDATGAGDAFVAGFLVQLSEDPTLLDSQERLEQALALANACGAITTKTRGAIPALPTREAAQELVKVRAGL